MSGQRGKEQFTEQCLLWSRLWLRPDQMYSSFQFQMFSSLDSSCSHRLHSQKNLHIKLNRFFWNLKLGRSLNTFKMSLFSLLNLKSGFSVFYSWFLMFRLFLSKHLTAGNLSTGRKFGRFFSCLTETRSWGGSLSQARSSSSSGGTPRWSQTSRVMSSDDYTQTIKIKLEVIHTHTDMKTRQTGRKGHETWSDDHGKKEVRKTQGQHYKLRQPWRRKGKDNETQRRDQDRQTRTNPKSRTINLESNILRNYNIMILYFQRNK